MTLADEGGSANERSCLVMLVDDQPMVAEALRRMLVTESDIDYHYCREPTEAVKMAEEIKPTTILLDLVMPEIDGMSILRYLRANPLTKDIPVVVLSSKEDAQLKAEAFEGGANDYLIKWPDRIEILARVRYHSQWYFNLKQRDEAFRALRVSQRQLAESNLKLQRLASLDGLTGLPNRRFFDERLEEEWLRAARQQECLSVVMIDIDHFKWFNDLYGHLEGDGNLRAVARAIADALHRPADLAARFGGEEFVLVLPNTDAQGACGAAEKVRLAVAALNIPHEKSSVAAHVTVSLGVASMVPLHTESPSVLVAKADGALYVAKSSGRNKFSLAE